MKTGRLEYTVNAFSQDAQDAMRGDLIRALVEIITNCDDAYQARGGEIRVSISRKAEPFKAVVSVSDKAGGLTGEQMEKAFIKLGTANEGGINDQGLAGTRGLFGRGAKDVAVLGKAIFTSIKNEKFSDLEIDPKTASYAIDRMNDTATLSDREKLKLAKEESGLTAQIFINKAISVPPNAELVRMLQSSVQLRQIINRNKVIFEDLDTNQIVGLQGLKPEGELILEKELSLLPKYTKPVFLKLFKLPTKATGTPNEYSIHGLVISGRGVAYENSFLTLNASPEAGWFCGVLDAPELYDLSRSIDKDKDPDPNNPTRVISRQRDGLTKSHPYYRALAAALEAELKPIFSEVAKSEGASRHEGENLRNKFNSISQVLGSVLQQILNEDESGELPETIDTDGKLFELSIIPPKRIIKVGDEVTLTLRAPESADLSAIDLSVADPGDAVELQEFNSKNLNWIKHSRLPVYSSNFRIKAKNLGINYLKASTKDLSTTAEINVVLFDPNNESICKKFEFGASKYQVSPGKKRNLLVRAPIEMTDSEVMVGILEPEILGPKSVTLKALKSGKAAVGVIQVTAGINLLETSVTAELNGQTIETKLIVKDPSSGKSPKVRVEIKGNENPPRRVDLIPESGELIVRIYGAHKSLKKVFGSHNGEKFVFEESDSALATISEIVASQLATYAVEKDAANNPIKYPDAASLFFRQREHHARIVATTQAGLFD